MSMDVGQVCYEIPFEVQSLRFKIVNIIYFNMPSKSDMAEEIILKLNVY